MTCLLALATHLLGVGAQCTVEYPVGSAKLFMESLSSFHDRSRARAGLIRSTKLCIQYARLSVRWSLELYKSSTIFTPCPTLHGSSPAPRPTCAGRWDPRAPLSGGVVSETEYAHIGRVRQNLDGLGATASCNGISSGTVDVNTVYRVHATCDVQMANAHLIIQFIRRACVVERGVPAVCREAFTLSTKHEHVQHSGPHTRDTFPHHSMPLARDNARTHT